ncbi:hypothetical protein O5O51_13680 [Sinirhodobacter sp. HNIBRBA609]|nr:hypothetical protein O5O51_13680 [Sinirhodobacter sp. HNIBRBA609]
MRNISRFRLPGDGEDETSIRDVVSAHLPDALLRTLHQLAGGETDFSAFRHRVETIVTRYERNEIMFSHMPKKDKASQLRKLEAAAYKLLSNMDGLATEIQDELSVPLTTIPQEAWEGWTLDDPMPEPIDGFEEAMVHVSRILRVTRNSLDQMNAHSATSRLSLNRALDRLIEDWASIYEFGTGTAAISACNYLPMRDEYGGDFFRLMVVFMDAYAPKGYFSEGALGQRIRRVLAEEA